MSVFDSISTNYEPRFVILLFYCEYYLDWALTPKKGTETIKLFCFYLKF